MFVILNINLVCFLDMEVVCNYVRYEPWLSFQIWTLFALFNRLTSFVILEGLFIISYMNFVRYFRYGFILIF